MIDAPLELGGLFSVEKQNWIKYMENGEYFRSAEVSEEQNHNMIDGRSSYPSGRRKMRRHKAKNLREICSK